MEIRSLTTVEEFRKVFALEMQVWGYRDPRDAVAVPVMAITVRHGGIMLGAFERGELVGFVYSIPGIKHGKPFQWSHMLAVREDYRHARLGLTLKLEQRKATIAMGLDLIEWTVDPLQAVNAHLNLHRLGATVGEYEIDAYGDSSSILHQGTPTDRFVARWEVRRPEVERAIAAPSDHVWHDPASASAPVVLRAMAGPDALTPSDTDLIQAAPLVLAEIPMGFTEMQLRNRELALRWRMVTRELFPPWFERGYQAVDFLLEPEKRKGTYLLVRG